MGEPPEIECLVLCHAGGRKVTDSRVLGMDCGVSKVFFDVNLSLDGFMAADGITAEEPLGQDGQRLREWAAGREADLAPNPVATVGALVGGRRTYDTSLPEWGAGGPHPPLPVFVITHAAPAEPPGDSVYTFVTDGIESALEQARAAAGERAVKVMGGAVIGQAYLAAGLVDEIVVHLVPVLLKAGTRMFDNLGPEHLGLELAEVVDTPAVTHLRYRVA
jgi:dihydrofolate reductase